MKSNVTICRMYLPHSMNSMPSEIIRIYSGHYVFCVITVLFCLYDATGLCYVTIIFTSAMNLYHFSIFKQSLKAGVPSEVKQASPDEMVRKVINLLSLSFSLSLFLTHISTDRACPEPAGEPEAVGHTSDNC